MFCPNLRLHRQISFFINEMDFSHSLPNANGIENDTSSQLHVIIAASESLSVHSFPAREKSVSHDVPLDQLLPFSLHSDHKSDI
jgi:hypothetical protein